MTKRIEITKEEVIKISKLAKMNVDGEEERFANQLFFLPITGSSINKCEVEELAVLRTLVSAANLAKASANPFGYLVIKAAVASARYSLFLLIASFMNDAIIGLNKSRNKPIIKNKPEEEERFLLPP